MTSSASKVITALPVVSVILLLIVMNSTDPTKNIASILLVFLLLYIFFASSLFWLLRTALHRLPLVNKLVGKTHMSQTRAYYIGSALAFAPVVLIAMQSLHQVRLLDISLVILLLAMVIFYIVKRTA